MQRAAADRVLPVVELARQLEVGEKIDDFPLCAPG
jgi:hypothetical protein